MTEQQIKKDILTAFGNKITVQGVKPRLISKATKNEAGEIAGNDQYIDHVFISIKNQTLEIQLSEGDNIEHKINQALKQTNVTL